MTSSRRRFLTAIGYLAAAAALRLYGTSRKGHAVAFPGLSDPTRQPIFVNAVPNALAERFKYVAGANNRLRIAMRQVVQETGLVDTYGRRLPTPVWGYGTDDGIGATWPGRTVERNVDDEPLQIRWENKLPAQEHLLPVDTNLHWAFSLHGDSSPNGVDYREFSIESDGVPVVPHVHGGRNDSSSDGNPEYFFTRNFGVTGPRWVSREYVYGGPDWNDTSGMTWYHDHALGITRLNVYAGLAGFFPLRDWADTGKPDNPAGLPADPYELGFAVQDRMFRSDGRLFYPAFPGDPFYDDFIIGEGAILPRDLFPGGGPTALAEFFGDHMLVNGIIWPKHRVERRQYRVRFLNGTDSRFMRLKFKVIRGGAADPSAIDPAMGYELPFLVIGSDQSLRDSAKEITEIDFIPGERLDLIVDFSRVADGDRVIVENLLGDSPFGGALPEDPDDFFPDRRTDRVMAFDVELPFDTSHPNTNVYDGYRLDGGVPDHGKADRVRKLALFEGTDEFGRLQPLLGTAEPVRDVEGDQVTGSLTWFQPITENPELGDTEIWELYNATGDAHPIHVHLVNFEVLNRQRYKADVIGQQTRQHNGTTGDGFRLEKIRLQGREEEPQPSERTRRDMVTALPGQVTRIKMKFEKPGRYVWHCHILSHEDHEMMRPFHVGPGAG